MPALYCIRFLCVSIKIVLKNGSSNCFKFSTRYIKWHHFECKKTAVSRRKLTQSLYTTLNVNIFKQTRIHTKRSWCKKSINKYCNGNTCDKESHYFKIIHMHATIVLLNVIFWIWRIVWSACNVFIIMPPYVGPLCLNGNELNSTLYQQGFRDILFCLKFMTSHFSDPFSFRTIFVSKKVS